MFGLVCCTFATQFPSLRSLQVYSMFQNHHLNALTSQTMVLLTKSGSLSICASGRRASWESSSTAAACCTRHENSGSGSSWCSRIREMSRR